MLQPLLHDQGNCFRIALHIGVSVSVATAAAALLQAWVLFPHGAAPLLTYRSAAHVRSILAVHPGAAIEPADHSRAWQDVLLLSHVTCGSPWLPLACTYQPCQWQCFEVQP